MANLEISIWQEKFNKLYGKVDEDRKPEDFWITISDHMSRIGEAIRKYDYPQMLKSASHSFAWMCEYVNCLNKCYEDPTNRYVEFSINKLSLSEIVGLKYPLVCGHCGTDICTCNAKKIEARDDKSIPVIELHDKWLSVKDSLHVFSIAKWLETFESIYQNNIRLQSLATIGFHLLEEVGEESRAIRHLIQFRDISNKKGEIVSNEYVKSLGNIPTLFSEYIKYDRKIDDYYALKNMSKDQRKKEYRIQETELFLKYRLIKAKMELLNEFADTFAWFCSILIKVQDMAKTMKEEKWLTDELIYDNDMLDMRIAKEYKFDIKNGRNLKCHSCDETECICQYYVKH